MPSDVPKTTLKFLAALLKHQAELWLGEQATDIVAGVLFEKRFDDWLEKEETATKLIEAAQRADAYFQTHCQDFDLQGAFRLGFGTLPSVQAVLAELPRAMDAQAVTDALCLALRTTLPNLDETKIEKGAQVYTKALLRAVSSLKEFALPVIAQVMLEISKKQDELSISQAEIHKKLDQILERFRITFAFQQLDNSFREQQSKAQGNAFYDGAIPNWANIAHHFYMTRQPIQLR
jgi:hypothetical protein